MQNPARWQKLSTTFLHKNQPLQNSPFLGSFSQEMENFWRMNQDNSVTESEKYDFRDHGGGFTDTAAKKGPWTAEEDERLRKCVAEHGIGNWVTIEKRSGLGRSSKSCRLRWINHLRPHLKKGSFSAEEEMLLVKLHKVHGNKWSYIATKLPGRTDNEIKNFWHGRVRRCHRKFLPIYPENIQDRDESCAYSLEMDGKNHQNDKQFYEELIQNPASIFSPQGLSSSNLPSPIFRAPQIPSPNSHTSIQQFPEQCMLSPQQSVSNTSVAFTPMRPPPVLSPLAGHFKRFQRTCSPLSSPRTMTQFPASESGSGSSATCFKINSAPSDICSSNLNPQNLYTNSMPQSMPFHPFFSEPPSIQTPTSAYRPIPEMKTDIKLFSAPNQVEQHVNGRSRQGGTKLSNPSDLLSRRLCRKFSEDRCIEAKDSMGKISRREGLLCEISKTGVLLVERGKKETILQGLLDERSTHRVSASKRSKSEDVGLEDGSKKWKFSGRNGESNSEIMYRNPVEDVVPSGENLESLRSRFQEFKESVSSLNDQDAFCGVPCDTSRGQEDDFSTFDLEFCDMDVLNSGDEDDQQKCLHTKAESSFSQEAQRGDFMDENLLDNGLLLLTSNDNQEILLEDIWNSIQPCRHEEASGESLENTNNGYNEHLIQKKQQEMQEACNMAEEMSNIPDWYDMGCESSAISDMVFELEMNYKDENSLVFQM